MGEGAVSLWLPLWALRLLAGPRRFDAAMESADKRAQAHGKAAFTLPDRFGWGEIQIGVEWDEP